MKEINEFLYLILHIHHMKQFLRYKVRISIKEGKTFYLDPYKMVLTETSQVINLS